MRQRRSGCIINVSSVAGRISMPPFTPYVASKWALEALSEALACEMKAFNVRVHIVEAGIIDAAMTRHIEKHDGESLYRHSARFASLFRAALMNPVPPSLTARQILEIVATGTWQLRHAGPDAAPFLEWRAGMTDEDWVDFQAAKDEAWYSKIESDLGVNARPEN